LLFFGGALQRITFTARRHKVGFVIGTPGAMRFHMVKDGPHVIQKWRIAPRPMRIVIRK